MRTRLFTPGPTQITDRVLSASASPMIYHRSPAFREIFSEVADHLSYLFQTRGQVLVLTSSGTGGMEACVTNLLHSEQKVLVISGGKFGARWGEISRAHRLQTITLEVPWGEAVDLPTLEATLRQNSSIGAVLCTHSETSTGVVHDVQEIARLVREITDALVIVDGITSVGVMPFYFDEWGIDACVGGSQKGTMAPPGLSFVALSERAWQRHQQSDLPRFYFDFSLAKKAADKGDTAWTPAVNVLRGLAESLREIRTQTLEYHWRHYATLARATRAAMMALGLEVFPKQPSNTLTAVKIPESIDGLDFTKKLREQYGIVVAGGQGQLKGRIFRVTHMGPYDELDMISVTAAVEMALHRDGWNFQLGSGLAAMQRCFAESEFDTHMT